MQHRREPCGKTLRAPNSTQCGARVAIEEYVAVLGVVRNKRRCELLDVANREVQAFRAGRRHDVRSVADQEQPSIAQRLGDEAAQGRNALLERRASGELRGELGWQARFDLVPKTLVVPFGDVGIELALQVAAAARRGTHAAQRKAAVVAEIDELG